MVKSGSLDYLVIFKDTLWASAFTAKQTLAMRRDNSRPGQTAVNTVVQMYEYASTASSMTLAATMSAVSLRLSGSWIRIRLTSVTTFA